MAHERPNDAHELGSLRPEVFDALARGRDRAELEGTFNEAAVAYSEAMFCAQSLEFAILLAVPAATLEPDDPHAEAKVDEAREERLAIAISSLEQAWPEEIEKPTDIFRRLDTARLRRNALAHDFWLASVQALFSDSVGELRAQLRSDAEMFTSLTRELISTVFLHVVDRRDLTVEQMNNFVSILMLGALQEDAAASGDILDALRRAFARLMPE